MRTFLECFPGDSQVTVTEDDGKTLQTKKISELNVNDIVLVADKIDTSEVIKFSKVVSFLHKIEKIDAKFIRIHFSMDANKTNTMSSHVTLTGKHLILVGRSEAYNESAIEFNYLPAKDVQIGDMLKYSDYAGKVHAQVSVTKVEAISLEKSGIYAPLTEQGTIIVDNIHASCYSMVKNHKIAQFFFSILNKINNIVKLTSQTYVYYSKFLLEMLDFTHMSAFFLNV